MSKTLRTLQVLSKIGRILSKIVFIVSIVGAALCLLSLLLLAAGVENGIRFGEVTLRSIIEESANLNVHTMYAAISSGILFCTGEAVLAKFAERYFRNELSSGTPFTIEGARELLRLGILTIAIPLGTALLSSIVYGVMQAVFADVVEQSPDVATSISLGAAFIVASLLCRHGAEIGGSSSDGNA